MGAMHCIFGDQTKENEINPWVLWYAYKRLQKPKEEDETEEEDNQSYKLYRCTNEQASKVWFEDTDSKGNVCVVDEEDTDSQGNGCVVKKKKIFSMQQKLKRNGKNLFFINLIL